MNLNTNIIADVIKTFQQLFHKILVVFRPAIAKYFHFVHNSRSFIELTNSLSLMSKSETIFMILINTMESVHSVWMSSWSSFPVVKNKTSQ